MSTSLSEIVDNMSENINSIECKSCTEYNRCEQCKKLREGLIKKFSGIHQFCNDNLNKFVLLLKKKVFIFMKILIAWKNLMKLHYQIKNLFIVT